MLSGSLFLSIIVQIFLSYFLYSFLTTTIMICPTLRSIILYYNPNSLLYLILSIAIFLKSNNWYRISKQVIAFMLLLHKFHLFQNSIICTNSEFEFPLVHFFGVQSTETKSLLNDSMLTMHFHVSNKLFAHNFTRFCS